MNRWLLISMFGAWGCMSKSSQPLQASGAADSGEAAVAVRGVQGAPVPVPVPALGASHRAPALPLEPVADVDLPGNPVRFDYQALDAATGNLIVAHMNDGAVVVVRARDGAVVKRITSIPMARGVAVADDVGRIFVTSAPNKVVILDNATLLVVGRVDGGAGPDGIAWDPAHKIVGVSDQGDGSASFIASSGLGTRSRVALGRTTGNIVFDPQRSVFWITVEEAVPPDRLVAINPVTATIETKIALPGCKSAHGLVVEPDGRHAVIACEGNSKVLRVDLVTESHPSDGSASGEDPDVMAIDPGLGWLYVAAESGDLTVFDLGKPGLVRVDREHPGDGSHSVAVDPAAHHVFFPLAKGPKGTPALRIMRPSGT